LERKARPPFLRERPKLILNNWFSRLVDKDHVYAWSRTRMRGWRVEQSPVLVTTITLKRLQKKGYESMLDYYLKVAPQFNEPLYTRTSRTVV